MSQPVPEEDNQALDVTETPPGEHDADLPDEADRPGGQSLQEENAESSSDQPSDG